MPGTNLSREEAHTRAALLSVDSYTVELDLTGGDTTFGSRTTVHFDCRQPGAASFADLVGAEVDSITLNGRALDVADVYADSRIRLDDLAEHNELVVHARCRYSRSGEGLHRFVDPEDDRVYLYTQFEVPDARRVFTTFEQPDLKATFTFHVTAPAHWTVTSNTPTPTPEAAGDGVATWRFPATKRMSTYITAVVAGEYHEQRDQYDGAHGRIEMGHFCRQSMKDALDWEWIGTITKQGFAWFEEHFGRYPFEKYDQLWVPEYNMGAMENAGCVTIADRYLPKDRLPASVTDFRCNVILHEMAHMWFGDLVTMRWWEDLWLNESFAEWAGYWAAANATEFTDAWTGFANARKLTGMRQDQLPSTHPIAADIPDLTAIEVNFDMITYAKGAAVLKQLVAWVGLEPFLAGLRQYFADHAYDNAEFDDLLTALEKSSGRELSGWAQEWLQQPQVNTLSPDFELGDDGSYRSFRVLQTAPPEYPTLRRHRLGIGLYDLVEGRLALRDRLEVDVRDDETEIPALAGVRQPDLLLLNDGDLTWAKVRLDGRSLATVTEHLSELEDSLARAVCWGAAWDLVRDAELPATRYLDLVLAHLPRETNAWGLTRLPSQAGTAVEDLSAPGHRDALRARWEQGIRTMLDQAEPGDESQHAFFMAWVRAARSEAGLADVAALLDGGLSFPGLELDQALRWTLITALARAGRAGDRIERELERDRSIKGQEAAAGARAGIPTPEAKAAAWQLAVHDLDTPNETRRAIAAGFMVPGQTELLQPYAAEYLAEATDVWERLGRHMGSDVLELLFPRPLASAELLAQVDAWLASTQANPAAKRLVEEGRADMARHLAAQECDARG